MEIDLGDDLADCLAGGLEVACKIDHSEHYRRLGDLLERPFDSDLFDCFGGLAETGGVDEAEKDSVYVQGLFDGVTGGAVDVGNDGAVFAEEALSNVLFPVFVAPAIATGTPFLMALPRRNESIRRLT